MSKSKPPRGPVVFEGTSILTADAEVRLSTQIKQFQEYLSTKERFRPIIVTGDQGTGKLGFVKYCLDEFMPPRTDTQTVQLSSFRYPMRGIDWAINTIREAKTRCIVVLNGAEGLDERELQEALNKLYNFKAVRNVIIITRSPNVRVRGARLISLGFIQGKIYGLRDQLTTSGRAIIPVLAPQIVSIHESLVQKLKKSPDDLFKITPRQLEEVIADLLIGMGMEVELTPATRDGGKDILAYTQTDLGKILCLVEAKQYSKSRPVGVSLVRSLFGTLIDHQATSGMLVTTSRFAKPAQQFQERHKYQLSLKDYGDVVSWLMLHKS